MGNCVEADEGDHREDDEFDYAPDVTYDQMDSAQSWGCTRWEFAERWHAKDVDGMKRIIEDAGESVCQDALHCLVHNALTMDPSEQRDTLFLDNKAPKTEAVLKQMMEDLLAAGLNVDTADADGVTALMRLLGTSIPSRMIKSALPMRESLCIVLLNSKANPRIKDTEGRTALHHLMSTRGELPQGKTYAQVEENIVNKMIAKKADIDAVDNQMVTPVMLAIAVDNASETTLQVERVRCLLKNGASVNKQDNDQRTALVYAALGLKEEAGEMSGCKETHQHYQIVSLLLDAGASLNKRAVVSNLEFPWIREIDDVEMVRQLRMSQDELNDMWAKFERHRHHADQVSPAS